MPTTNTTAAVIGAGVVGLAVARALAQRGHEVFVLEAEQAIGTQTSSRSSEVIHAGIYYPPGSLKARLCVEGRHQLYAYCTQRNIGHRRTGKLIVATDADQLVALQALAQRAAANGVNDLQWLTASQAQALEPALRCHAALLSPSTGIIDSHSLMLALQGDLEQAGGVLALCSPAVRIEADARLLTIITHDGTQLPVDFVVNAAGHGAIPLARRTAGLAAGHIPTAYFVKGQYFSLTGKAPFQHLIYPIPVPGGLGIHLTLDLGGQARFGPDAQFVERADDLQVNPDDLPRFAAAIRSYWPDLPAERLQPGYAGMRPNIGGPAATFSDFIIQDACTHGIPGLINLFGIESPGLTACLAIAEEVARRADLQRLR
ncbi:FAD-dependent oxidoreductase [Lampropedia cohaerens]|uniref:FAD-dependent oxidoreductase n=1 Tax=Lampropedia cohaerens TaxID=1610491 RepID=A0A0U1Q162_9BURK|nr:NAD(P)/FAD-dependent oxidoreductase [Lampropedia cohaerens]KKW68498.1 FAD-dependent oxidoreductase [Lampropedia cohaerens]